MTRAKQLINFKHEFLEDIWLQLRLFFLELSEESLIITLNALSRQDIIEWLCWNDSNGIYQDEQSLKELDRIMTRVEGIEIMLRQIEENRVQ